MFQFCLSIIILFLLESHVTTGKKSTNTSFIKIREKRAACKIKIKIRTLHLFTLSLTFKFLYFKSILGHNHLL